MEPARWRQIEGLYHAAQARPAEERAAFLAEACANDEELRRYLESLLATPATADTLFGRPDMDVAGVARDSAPVVSGRQLGVYRVQERIGMGGMGDVYRARDSRLGRDVALKILPALFAADPERLARFEREARVLASLNHPNIATIHGLEESDGLKALVMELVDGVTLAQRIAVGPMALVSTLDTARQMAEALAAAHDKGIVHRDFKPANVKITPDGTVKVLDFGLAKLEELEGRESPQQATAASLDATRPGTILGTTAYMSPEQARGQRVDKRADIWAFGCVLFEMLTGRAVFARPTVPDTVAAILERQPDWTALPPSTPPVINRLLRRCLEKDSRARVQHIAAGIEAIRQALDDLESIDPGRSHAATRWKQAAVLGTVGVAAVVIGFRVFNPPAGAPQQESPRQTSVVRATSPRALTIDPPKGGTIVSREITCGTLGSDCSADLPDGSHVTLDALADRGFAFVRFTGACAPDGQTTMTQARTCGATFVQIRTASPDLSARSEPPAPGVAAPGARAANSVPPATMLLPAPPEVIAKSEIQGLLSEYCTAYRDLSIDALRRLFPAAPEAIREQFRQYSSVRCTFTTPPEYQQLDPTIGTAKLVVNITLMTELKVGGAQTNELKTTMTLSRPEPNGRWHIVSVVNAPRRQ